MFVFLVGYLAVFLYTVRRSALQTMRLRDQLERLEWPPAEALEFIEQRQRNGKLAFQALHYGTAVALAACALGTLVA